MPIPYTVANQAADRVAFDVNDPERIRFCIRNDRCAICGQTLTRGRWFVGGPLSCFHAQGWFIDPPLHVECMRYAVVTCPYLALPSWRSELRPAAEDERADAQVIVDRPEAFFAVLSIGSEHHVAPGGGLYVRPAARRRVECWRHGQQLREDQWRPIVERALASTPARVSTSTRDRG